MECPCGGLGWDALVAAWGRLGWNALVVDLDGMPLWGTWIGCPCGGLGWDALVAAWGGLGLDALVVDLDGMPLWRHRADLDGNSWNALAAELDGMPSNLAFRNPTYTAARCQILPISKKS